VQPVAQVTFFFRLVKRVFEKITLLQKRAKVTSFVTKLQSFYYNRTQCFQWFNPIVTEFGIVTEKREGKMNIGVGRDVWQVRHR